MKNVPSTLLKNILTMLFFIVFFSCSNEDDLNTDENNETPTSPTSPDSPDSPVTAIEECFISDFDIAEGNTIIINCLLDLEGQTLEVPNNVTFQFDGGDIFNGTLNFTSSGKIDGELLNSKLIVEGDVQLTSDTFTFYTNRWNIIEGETTSEIALQNTTALERLFFWVKELGASTFSIDKLDAYFETSKVTSTTTNQNFYPSVEALNVPSNFNLVMSDNTHLRIYPYSADSDGNATLMSVYEVENVTITGGNFHGDRYEYYLTEDNEEGNGLFRIRSGKNIVIDNVYFENATTTGFTMNSVGFSFNDDYNPNENITVKNCTFYNNRAMSMSITDGRNITVENNSFIDSSQPTEYSDGGVVGYAINIEPVRTRDDEGNLIEYQKVFDVLIKGNTETNSRAGFLIVFVAQDVVVEENTIDTRMAWSLASGTRIRNNTFDATNSWASESWAFSAGGVGETVFDNEFSGNTITGYGLGVNVGSIDADIFENTITNVSVGMQVNNAYNATIYNNTVEAENRGIFIGNTNTDNVTITGNTITSSSSLINVSAINEDDESSDYSVLIDDNVFYGEGVFSLYRANGVTFSNNEVHGGVSIAGDVSNAVVDGNIIKPNERHGITIYNNHENVTVSNNTIYEPTGASHYECLNNESTTPNEVTQTNNTCN